MVRRMLAGSLCVLVLLVGSSDALAQKPRLVKDIQENGDARPVNMASMGKVLYFEADDGIHGRELWRSDGTEAGTWMVKDIYPGNAGSYPAYITAVGGALYFAAEDDIHGRELWKSDGTEVGTVLVADIHPGSEGSLLHDLFAVGCQLFFAADDGSHGDELWVMDVCEMTYVIYLPLVVRSTR